MTKVPEQYDAHIIARATHYAALNAALPAEPPEWFWEDWWMHHGAHANGKQAWAEFRAHLLGEDA